MVLDEVKGESIARHLLDQGAVWANSGREVAEQCPSAASHGPVAPHGLRGLHGLRGREVM